MQRADTTPEPDSIGYELKAEMKWRTSVTETAMKEEESKVTITVPAGRRFAHATFILQDVCTLYDEAGFLVKQWTVPDKNHVVERAYPPLSPTS